MENIFVEFLPPWVETGLQPAFYDKESGTVLQQTARMYSRVNMLIRMFNKLSKNTKTTVEEYITKFNELYTYVHDYFDNLDVQEEINNKLDEMVEDGTLTDIIDEYFADRVKYVSGKFETGTFSNDSHLIITSKHTILIDCGLEGYLNALIARLMHYSVTHIDYLIISHYDLDHIGGLTGLINAGYIDSETVVYLPYVPTRFTSMITVETGVKNLLDANNIAYSTPSNLETIQVDSLDVTFGNLDANYAEANYTNYNFTSMVVKIKHHDVLSFWAGDAGTPTYNYLYNTGFINTHIDLYKIGHHGIDYSEISPFATVISPDYVIQPFDVLDYIKNNSHNQELAYLQNTGSRIIPVCAQSDYIEFESSFNSLACIHGETRTMSGCHCDKTLYVDKNASQTNIQDGTSDHPFTTIMQAVAYTKNFPEGNVVIQVADGDYHGINASSGAQKHKVEICNSKVRYQIRGNSEAGVIISPVKVNNNSILRLENVTVVADSTYGDESGVDIWNSDVTLSHCTITTENDESSNHNGVVVYDGGNVYCENVTIKNYKNGVRTNRGSTSSFNTMTFTNVTTPYSQSHGFIEPVNILTAFDRDTGIGTLVENVSNFKQINITYSTHGTTNRGSCTINNPGNTDIVFASVPVIGSDHSDYEKRARISFNANKQVVVDRQNKFYISSNGSTVSIAEETNEKIEIDSIFAI